MNNLEKEMQIHNELSKERGPFLTSKSMKNLRFSNER